MSVQTAIDIEKILSSLRSPVLQGCPKLRDLKPAEKEGQ
jgi:hypothetical protein